MKRDQMAPLSIDAYTATDEPTNSRFGLVGSSRMTCRKSPGASLGRLLTIDLNVLPPSTVAYRYGVKSLLRWLSKATQNASESKCEGSTRVT